MAGVRRYSRNPIERRWQEKFDELQRRCLVDYYAPTIGDLLDHGITRAEWRCRGWGSCWHCSEPFALGRFSRDLTIAKLRRNYVCSECGRNRPNIELLAG